MDVTICEQKIAETFELFREKKYEQLINYYREIIEYKEKNSEANLYKYYSNLSKVLYEMGRFDDAADAAEQCVKLAPNWYKGYYRGAKADEARLNRDGAARLYEQMLRCEGPTKLERDDASNLDINLLRAWLIRNGAKINKIQIEYYAEDYRGMCVEAPVKKGEKLIEIPLKCLLSLEDSKQAGLNAELLKRGADFASVHTYLAIALLEVKADPQAEFNFGVRCLPKYFDNVPINFPEGLMGELEGSYALVKIAQKKQILAKEYRYILSLMPGFPFTLDEFIWARTAIITRVYAVKRDGKKDTFLVPFADMANHDIPANTHWYYNESNQMFTVEANQYLESRENLFESYGKKSNYRYFVNYGFTIENNPFDEVAVVLDPIAAEIVKSRLYLNNELLLDQINQSKHIYQIGFDVQSDEVKKMVEYAKQYCHEMQPGREAYDAEAYRYLIEAMRTALSRFPEPAQNDKRLLSSAELDFNRRNCVVQRMQEKKILEYYIGYFGILLKGEFMSLPKRAEFLRKQLRKYKHFV